MSASVREHASACPAGSPNADPRLSALPQASEMMSHALAGQDAFVVVLLVVLLMATVVLTAIWSADKDRRKAALDVLDRLIRWRS